MLLNVLLNMIAKHNFRIILLVIFRETEDEMAGWHHWLNGRESEWTQGVGDGQGGLVCCDLWGRKGFATTEQLNWAELNSPIPAHFSWLIPKMSMFTLAISCLTTSNLSWFMDLTFQVPMQYCFYSIGLYFHHQSHPQLGVVFALAPYLHSFWSYLSTALQ